MEDGAVGHNFERDTPRDHLCQFHQQIWPPRAILVSDWLLFKKIFSSKTAWQNGAKLGSDKAYQLFVHGRWFSPGTPASSTTKPGRHDIELPFKVHETFWI
jgi:hypothetical protein